MAFIRDSRTGRGPNLSLTDMALKWTLLGLFIFVDFSRTYAQEVCPARDVTAAGRRCERPCSEDGTCRKQNRECVCDGLCGFSCLRRSELCERNAEEISRLGRRCMRPCDSSDDCLGNRECVCDDICGMSCIPTGREDYCPRLQERGANFTLTIEPSSRAFGSVATYSCRRNFERVRGDAEMKCLGVGEWSGTPSVCLHRYRCNPPPEIENARPIVMKDYYDHEEQVAFSCSPGFARVGGIRAVLTCYRNTWTEPQFQCRRKSCGDPGYLPNGRRIGTSFLFRDTVQYECDVGYRLIGAEERYCQSNQEWTRVTPTCQVVRCPAVTHPNNGRRIGYELEYDSELDFRCNTGYILEGNDEIRCQANGTWSRPVPTCREIRCPAPAVPEHGSSDADRSEYSYGDAVTFSCADEYQLRGSSEVTCSSNENWFPPPPICQATCIVPTSPYYGGWQGRVRDGQRVVEGHELGYYCRSSHFKCQTFPLRCVNGSWTPPASDLCLRSCPMQTAETVGLTISYSHPSGISCTHPDLKPVGTIRSFTCLRGYRIPFGVSHQSTCHRRNNYQRWSSSLPTCEKILCPRIDLHNGGVRYTLNGIFTSTLEQNTTASFLCNQGYEKSHHNSSSCDIGQWTNGKPDCIEQPCSESSIAVGNWYVGYDTPAPESSPGYRRPGTVASFNCIEHGYSTSIQHICRRGQWDGEQPICQRIPCPDQFLNNGNLIYTSDRIAHGTFRTYRCNEGFTFRGIESSYCDAGRWTNDLPECIEDPCRENDIDGGGWERDFNLPSNEPGLRPPGTVVVLRCPRGYDTFGTKTCQAGTWTGSPLSCEIMRCQEEGLDHGLVLYEPPRPEHGTLRTFECRQGYHFLDPPGASLCDEGVWTTELPSCVEDPCRETDIVDDQWRIIYDRGPEQAGMRPHGTVASFQCTERGHVTSDTKECRTGQWTGRHVVCNKIPCESHGNVPNGDITYSTDLLEQGTILSVTCHIGYQLSQIGQASCDLGRWTPDIPSCVEKSCDEGSLRNEEWNVTITYQSDRNPRDNMKSPGTVVTLACDSYGYLAVPIRGQRKTCSRGEWIGDQLLCDRGYCPALPSEDYSFIIYNGTSSTETEFSPWIRVEVQCPPGMYPGIDGRAICRLGQWTPGIPTCSESAPCPAVDDLPGRTIFYSDRPPYTHGSNLTVMCDPGDTLIGSEESTCMAGSWIPVVGDCFSNVAHDKTAYQKSRPYWDGEASKATDGVNTTGRETCAFSYNRLQDPWWFVDLGNTYTVEQILIYRPMGYRNRLLNSVVRVGQERGTQLGQNTMVGEITDVNSNPIIIHVNGSVKGRFVSVEDAGYSDDALILCEVEVLGKLSGDECESACVVPTPLYNGYYSSHQDGTTLIEDGGCFNEQYLYIFCNEWNRQGSHVYFCDTDTGALSPHIAYTFGWSRCGSNCPRPQVNPNVVYHVGNDPVNNHTFFRTGEVITSRCEDPTFQLHVGSVNMRCEANGEWSHAAPRCVTSKLRMDVASASSVTTSSNGSFVMLTTTDEVTVNCAMNQSDARLEDDSQLLKDETILWPIEKSLENSVIGFTIENPTTADSGVYRCISGELSHSIRILFEDPPPCPRPPISDSNIVIIGLSGSRVTADRQSFNDGDALTFVCENDRVHQRIDGPQQVQCRNGEWILVGTNDRMENTPTCATSGCRRPHINPGVMVHVGADDIPVGSRQFFTEGEIITSRCDDPRPKLLIGPVRRRCTDEGWTEIAPSCEDSQLRIGVENTRLFDFLPDGTFVVFPIFGQVWITCRKLSGSPFASSATISTDSSARGRLVPRSATVRRMVIYNPTPASSGTYTCRDTNSLSRSINIRFQDIRCAEPDRVSNGRWEHIKVTENDFSYTSYIFKETVRLYCNDGYRVNGMRDSQCNYHGRWSPPLASCVAN